MSIFGNKVYELPLTRDYVANWTVVDAVRELLQNAIDSTSPFDVTQGASTFAIRSAGARLDRSTLALGRSSKKDDKGTIGQFGEGYKLALLVLLRENRHVHVVNGNVIWTPEFRVSNQFGIETLHIIEGKSDKGFDGVEFVIEGLDGDDQNAIKNSCLLMQPTRHDDIHTSYGDIMPSKPGQLYVGGLFVCNTSLDYGYNLNPGEVELERDRKTIDGFNLRWKTKDVWLSTGDHKTIVELMDRACPDVELLEYDMPSIIKEECYRHFVSKNPGKVIAKNQEELQRLVENGMKVYVSTGNAYYAGVTSHHAYKESFGGKINKTPSQELAEWYDNNKRYMSRIPSANFKLILEKSKKWAVK